MPAPPQNRPLSSPALPLECVVAVAAFDKVARRASDRDVILACIEGTSQVDDDLIAAGEGGGTASSSG